MGWTPVGGSENSFSEYFGLRTLVHYLHFIQVSNPFIKNILFGRLHVVGFVADYLFFHSGERIKK